jgi:hypothetical protein
MAAYQPLSSLLHRYCEPEHPDEEIIVWTIATLQFTFCFCSINPMMKWSARI